MCMSHRSGAFSLTTLWILFLIYFFITCWTYGAGIPSGLFIPCIMIGATYGRFVATAFGYSLFTVYYNNIIIIIVGNYVCTCLTHYRYISTWQPYFSFLTNIYPGTYALIGAASFLGGVVRMTISLTVILIESTNEISYGLPIMLTLMVKPI